MLGAILPLHDVRYHATIRTHKRHDGCETCFLTDEQQSRAPRERGGARRDRTDDLLLAKQALSQLSYGPDSPAVRLACRAGARSNQPAFASRLSPSRRRRGSPHLAVRAKAGGPGKI